MTSVVSLTFLTVATAWQTPTTVQQTADAIDHELEVAWKEQGLAPVAAADDATWLRRLSVDVRGVIPTADEVEHFLADPDPGKRARTVDEFLESPLAAENLAFQWTDLLESAAGKDALVMKMLLRPWLEEQFGKKASWASVTRRLLADSGVSRRPGSTAYLITYRESIETLAATTARAFLGLQIQCAQCHDHPNDHWKRSEFDGFAGFFLDMRGDHVSGSQRGGVGFRIVDHSPEWDLVDRLRRLSNRAHKGAANDGAMKDSMKESTHGASMRDETMRDDTRNVDLQMDAPTDADLEAAAAASAATSKASELAALGELIKSVESAPKGDAMATLDADPTRRDDLMNRVPPDARDVVAKYRERKEHFATATFLDGARYEPREGVSRRAALADWLVDPKNAWFGHSMVNRTWAHFLGKGLVEPIDDLSGAKDRVVPRLFDLLAEQFVAHDTDVRFLIGAIVRTKAYAAGASSDDDAGRRALAERWFCAHPLRPFTSEEFMKSLLRATGDDDDRAARAKDLQLERNWLLEVKELESFASDDAIGGTKRFSANIPQALYLMNGSHANETAAAARARYVEEFTAPDERAKLRRLFLDTLGRPPSPREAKELVARVGAAKGGVAKGVEDLDWALLNSAEFQTNH